MKFNTLVIFLCVALALASGGIGCGANDKSPNAKGNTLDTNEAANTYSVDLTERNKLIELAQNDKKGLKNIQAQILAVAKEDQAAFPSYVDGKNKDRGIIRLMINDKIIPAEQGSYYNFSKRERDFAAGADIKLEMGQFYTGFAGADFGFFANLGAIALDDVKLDTPGVQFAATYAAPTAVSKDIIDLENHRFGVEAGVLADGFNYKSAIPAKNGLSYVLRSIAYDRADVLVAFQVVRRDDTDKSLILIWKVLKTNPVPTLSH